MLSKTKPRHSKDQAVGPRVAVVLAGGLLIVTAFQAALTIGAPLGAAAWEEQTAATPRRGPASNRLLRCHISTGESCLSHADLLDERFGGRLHRRS